MTVMKTVLTDFRSPIRWLLIGLTSILMLLVILPPLVSSEWHLVIYQALSPICHQIPERSFSWNGVQFGVCVRCTGIGTGFLLGLLIPWKGLPFWKASTILLVAVTPALIDWLLGFSGIWDSWITSSLTGLWMGGVLAGAVIRTQDS